jgi:two-component system, NarL family, invasion response regulator UvrY
MGTRGRLSAFGADRRGHITRHTHAGTTADTGGCHCEVRVPWTNVWGRRRGASRALIDLFAEGQVETCERDAALNAPTVKVMTVDDHAVFRDAARAVIEATAGFEHVGDATSGEEALALVEELHPDLILIDVCMPGIDGLETARRLRVSRPGATTVLISTADVENLAIGFATCGAAAFVRKQDFGRSLLGRLWAEHGRRSEV